MIAICCVTDDKPGHKSQIDGLLQAITKYADTHTQWLHINDSAPISGPLDLILAAGHRTHKVALKLRWKHGGKLVVLMKPSLPLWLFDLCLIPEHDDVKASKRVFNTTGAINPIQPSATQNPKHGLILIGGPSKHFAWSDDDMLTQLRQLKDSDPQLHWTLTSSRRTPGSFLGSIAELEDTQFTITPLEQTDRHWLLQKFQDCGVIWVTEDSVSMIYESLSSGAAVGVLKVPELKPNRISRNIHTMIDRHQLITLSDLKKPELLASSMNQPLNEADRAARYITQWLGLAPGNQI